MSHTPGPWEIQDLAPPINIYGPEREDGTRPWVAECGGDEPYNSQTDEANARLIAAAPDLLEACRRAAGYLQTAGEHIDAAVEFGGDVNSHAMQDNIERGLADIAAAIAKATGKRQPTQAS